MKIEEVKHPYKLCIQMVSYCIWDNKKVEDYKWKETLRKLSYFFTREEMEFARKYLCNKLSTKELNEKRINN